MSEKTGYQTLRSKKTGADMKRGKPCERTSEWAQVERIATQWLKRNWRNVQEECESMVGYEVGFSIYRDPNGNVQATKLAQGVEAEVKLPDAPKGCVLLGSLHTHVGSDGELSPWDNAQGQKIANEIGSPYYMFVVGPASENDSGIVMSQELFEPDVETKNKPRP